MTTKKDKVKLVITQQKNNIHEAETLIDDVRKMVSKGTAGARQIAQVEDHLTAFENAYAAIRESNLYLLTVDSEKDEATDCSNQMLQRKRILLEKAALCTTEINNKLREEELDTNRIRMDNRTDGASGATRTDRDLKPDKLTEEATPVEFEKWRNRFLGWFDSGNSRNLPIIDQRRRLEAVLEQKVESHLAVSAAPDATIAQCLQIIEELINVTHPLHIRRINFLDLREKVDTTRPYSEFITTLQEHGRNAEIHRMSEDDQLIMHAIHCCPFVELKRDLKIRQFNSIRELKNHVVRYDQATCDEREKLPTEQVNKVFSRKNNGKQRCGKCKKNHPTKDCLAHIECYFCKNKGHYERDCRKKQREEKSKDKKGHAKVTRKEDSSDSSDSDAQEGQSYVVKKGVSTINNPTPLSRMKFQPIDKSARFYNDTLADSGCTHSLISSNIVEEWGLENNNASKLPTMRAANGSSMTLSGRTELLVTPPPLKKPTKLSFLICKDMTDEIILSWSDCVTLGILSKSYPLAVHNECKKTASSSTDSSAEQKSFNELKEVLTSEFPDVINDEINPRPMKGGPMRIHFRDDKEVKPIHVARTKQIPASLQGEADRIINDLLSKGIISRVHEPTKWVSPAFFVPKGDPKEGKLRLVTDYSHLNRYVQRPVHPFPSAKEIMRKIPPGAQYFMKCDAVSGYFQIELDERDRHFTTFLLPNGRFMYNRAPHGILSLW